MTINTNNTTAACSGDMIALADELREFTAMKYMGDCKCGKCQLVPRAFIDKLYSAFSTTQASAPRSASAGGGPVAWRVCCTQNGATGYLYTEVLPFEPGPGVNVRREPEPLYSAPPPIQIDQDVGIRALEKIVGMAAKRRTDNTKCHCTVCEMRDVAETALASNPLEGKGIQSKTEQASSGLRSSKHGEG